MLIVDSAYNVEITRGDTGIFKIALKDSEGEAYQPNVNDKLYFSMAKKAGSEILIEKEIPIDTMTLRIDPTDTEELPFGTYRYDIQLVDFEEKVSTVILADFTLTEEIG